MSMEDFSRHLNSFLYECFTKFDSSVVYVFVFELVNSEQVCVSTGDVDKNEFMSYIEK